jgi:hypothetical protein
MCVAILAGGDVLACVRVPLSILQSLVKKLERICFCFCLLNEVVVVYVTCSSAYIYYTMREEVCFGSIMMDLRTLWEC